MTDQDHPLRPLNLHCRRWGSDEGPPVVLLHGAGADSTTWDVVREWPTSWRMLSLDLRGHGRSPWAESYQLTDMMLDVVASLDKLQLSQVDVVSHSLGAMVAYLLAEDHHDRIRRLVLVEPPPPVPASPPREEGSRPEAELNYDWDFQPAFSRQRNDPDPSWWRDLASISAPTLILVGSDGSLPRDKVTAMARRIPDCELHVLDAGHQLHEDRPVEFVATLSKFLGN